LQLITGLNRGYAQESYYASHMLLRAILDHIPPLFGVTNFDTVASQTAGTATFHKYMKKLRDFRLQADEALHKQISERGDYLELDDMPQKAAANALLQECAARLLTSSASAS